MGGLALGITKRGWFPTLIVGQGEQESLTEGDEG